MRSSERPPKPPESPVNRELIIGLLAYLANHIKPKKSGDILLYTPVKIKNSDPIGALIGLSPVDLSEVYALLKGLLNDNLEEKTVFDILQEQQPALKKGGSYSRAWLAVSLLAFLPPEDNVEQVKKRREPLHNRDFERIFGYNTVIRGLNDEVLALVYTSETDDKKLSRPSLLLGMPVRFEKKNSVESPLFG